MVRAFVVLDGGFLLGSVLPSEVSLQTLELTFALEPRVIILKQ